MYMFVIFCNPYCFEYYPNVHIVNIRCRVSIIFRKHISTKIIDKTALS